MILSKVLSLGVIAGAVVVRVPQIMKLVNSKSARGLQLMSFMIEVIRYNEHDTVCVDYTVTPLALLLVLLNPFRCQLMLNLFSWQFKVRPCAPFV